ncbi:MAG: NAD(P)-binding protein [Ilumatobacter sp.]|nr:NAD(P)-binding protein [Ilumatobacter sp.]
MRRDHERRRDARHRGRQDHRPDTRRRRQPGHPHPARRQRGTGRADPHRRADGHQRRRARADDRACVHVQPRPARFPRPRRTRTPALARRGRITGRRRSELTAVRVAIVGAGLAGLVAGRALQAAGATVQLFDKGRSPGGRLATRRIGGATVDHGAQFFTARTPAFARQVAEWQSRGLVRVWSRGFGDNDGHDRYVGTDGMNSLAKDLARGQSVSCSTMAFAVRPTGDGGWKVVLDDGAEHAADAVIVTCPLPQAFALLIDSGVDLDESVFRVDYDRTIGFLARLDGPAALPPTGGVQNGDEVFSFIGDNAHKGISTEPAVTFHASPAWSEANWHEDHDTLARLLTTAARPWLGASTIVEHQLKKWRLATPRTIWPDPCWTTAGGRIVVAGDAFAGPRVEGAHNSGLAAAHALLG